MRAFQVACIALATASASAVSSYGYESGLGSSYYGSGYGLGGASYVSGYAPSSTYTTGYTQSPAGYGYSAVAAPVSYGYAASVAPVSYGIAAAPVAAAPVYTQIAAPAPAAVKSHEIHTTSGRQAIRIEEIQGGDQVIRVHEAPQAGPQVAQVRVPGEQHHVRVINHQSGPAEVQRVVQRQQTQVFDVQKPGRPGARIVQVVRAESPAPTVEFVSAGGSNHHVYHANDATSYGAGPVTASYSGLGSSSYGSSYSGLGSSAYGSSYSVPSYTASYSAPSYATGYSAPSYSTGYSAPSYSTGAAYQSGPSAYSYSGSLGGTSGVGSYGSTAVISKA